MKIKLTTNIVKNNKRSDKCYLFIEHRKIQDISFDNKQLYKTHKIYKPTDFRVEKISSINDYKREYGFNYFIKFRNGKNEETQIPLNLSLFQLIKLNFIKRKYWIQVTNNWVKFIIPIVTSYITYLITRGIFCN